MGLRDDIAAVGIAKQLNELFFPGDSVPLYIDKNGETIRVIQRLRDEAHRFAITHHRAKRGKAQLHSDLDDIKGIGEKTKQLLLKHFKSVKRIREATADEIAAVVSARIFDSHGVYFALIHCCTALTSSGGRDTFTA